MVSPQNPVPSSIAPGPLRSDRGFVEEEIVVSSAPAYSPAVRYPYPLYFWGSVIAGTLVVLSLFTLSYLLMIGCHVGVTAEGLLSLGWGAAIWLVVTSCIAYYIGGMTANSISRPLGTGWLKGISVWGLSIPLALVISAVVAGGTGLFAGLTMPEVGQLTSSNAQQVANNLQPHMGLNFGFVWTAFITLIAGLVFAIFGSGSVAVATGMLGADGRTCGPAAS